MSQHEQYHQFFPEMLMTNLALFANQGINMN